MPELFEKTAVKSLDLDNRSVRSATWSGVGDAKGYVTEKAFTLYGDLARGGVGLIVTGFQYVLPNGIGIQYQVGNYPRFPDRGAESNGIRDPRGEWQSSSSDRAHGYEGRSETVS